MQSIPNNRRWTDVSRALNWPPLNLVYYPANTEYDLIMNKYPFHDSGIVDEGLSDETGSVEDESTQQENLPGKKLQLDVDGLSIASIVEDKNSTPKKPNQSYLELIAEAILKTPNRMMQLYEIYNYFQRKYVEHLTWSPFVNHWMFTFFLGIDTSPKMWINPGRTASDTTCHWTIALSKLDEERTAKDTVSLSTREKESDWMPFLCDFSLANSRVGRTRIRARTISTTPLSSTNAWIPYAKHLCSFRSVRWSIGLLVLLGNNTSTTSLLHVFAFSSLLSSILLNTEFVHWQSSPHSLEHLFDLLSFDILSSVRSVLELVLSDGISSDGFVLCKSKWSDQFRRLNSSSRMFLFSVLFTFVFVFCQRRKKLK